MHLNLFHFTYCVTFYTTVADETLKKTLKNEFYTKYDSNDLMSKARVISAKQLNKIQPVLKSERNQKEINTLINSAVQEILLNKAETQSILDRVSKNWKMLNSDNKNHQI